MSIICQCISFCNLQKYVCKISSLSVSQNCANSRPSSSVSTSRQGSSPVAGAADGHTVITSHSSSSSTHSDSGIQSYSKTSKLQCISLQTSTTRLHIYIQSNVFLFYMILYFKKHITAFLLKPCVSVYIYFFAINPYHQSPFMFATLFCKYLTSKRH